MVLSDMRKIHVEIFFCSPSKEKFIISKKRDFFFLAGGVE